MNTYTKGKSSGMQFKKKTLQKELYMYIFFFFLSWSLFA